MTENETSRTEDKSNGTQHKTTETYFGSTGFKNGQTGFQKYETRATLNGRVPNSATTEAFLDNTGIETGHAAIEALRGLIVKSSALATEANLGISGFQTGITENYILCLKQRFPYEVLQRFN